MRTQLHYYPVENMDDDDDDGYPVFAWDTKCNAPSAYMMLGRFLHNMYPTSYYMLTNERQRTNRDGDAVTIHDVEYIDMVTGKGIDTIGYVHVWAEEE